TAQKQRKTRWRDSRQHENKEKHVGGTPDSTKTKKNTLAGLPTAQKQRKTRWRGSRQHENKEKHVGGTPDSMKTEE
ncbi:hypothetical protein, partial [Parabacteroides merdae]